MQYHRPRHLLPSAGKIALALFFFLVGAALSSAQSVRGQSAQAGDGSRVSQANAAIAERPPVLDGKDDDAVWQTATPITGFRVFDPKEDGDPSFQTEARIAYDAENLYVFTRMFDPHHDSIVSL